MGIQLILFFGTSHISNMKESGHGRLCVKNWLLNVAQKSNVLVPRRTWMHCQANVYLHKVSCRLCDHYKFEINPALLLTILNACSQTNSTFTDVGLDSHSQLSFLISWPCVLPGNRQAEDTTFITDTQGWIVGGNSYHEEDLAVEAWATCSTLGEYCFHIGLHKCFTTLGWTEHACCCKANFTNGAICTTTSISFPSRHEVCIAFWLVHTRNSPVCFQTLSLCAQDGQPSQTVGCVTHSHMKDCLPPHHVCVAFITNCTWPLCLCLSKR